MTYPYASDVYNSRAIECSMRIDPEPMINTTTES